MPKKSARPSMLFLCRPVTAKVVEKIMRGIEAAECDGRPVVLHINSEGGCADSALALVDLIRAPGVRVNTCVVGCAYSSAFLIALAGRYREAMQSATYMLHDIEFSDPFQSSEAQQMATYAKAMRTKFVDIIAANSELTHSQVEAAMIPGDSRIFGAKEAKRLGVCDEIIEHQGRE